MPPFGHDRTPGKSGSEGGNHYANFIDAVRARDISLQHGPVESAHLSSALAHLGIIAYQTGRVLTFNPYTEKFVNDPEADGLLTRNYREPFVVREQA
ncbi:MAG: hypothetical protein ACLFQA_03030 [Bacteroidales bacterium]